MIDSKDPGLSVSRQCRLLDLARSSYYYRPTEESDEDLRLMRLIDERYLACPFFGSRRMCDHLRELGFCVMDWHTRRVLSYRLSNTLEADFCVEALEEALERHGPPEIFNTDSEYVGAGFLRVA